MLIRGPAGSSLAFISLAFISLAFISLAFISLAFISLVGSTPAPVPRQYIQSTRQRPSNGELASLLQQGLEQLSGGATEQVAGGLEARLKPNRGQVSKIFQGW